MSATTFSSVTSIHILKEVQKVTSVVVCTCETDLRRVVFLGSFLRFDKCLNEEDDNDNSPSG